MADETLDPLYYGNLAKINFQKEQSLAQNKATLERQNAGYAYSKSQLSRAEPRALQNTRNQANSQGLLESGQLADRRGQVQTDYAVKQGRNTELRKQAIDQYNSGNKSANDRYGVEDFSERLASGQRAKEALLANPPVPAPEAASPAVAGPQPPRVVGVKAQPNSSGVRKQAAKRALGYKGWGVG